MSRDPALQVSTDERWVDVPVWSDGDPGDWAEEVVERLLRRHGRSEPPAVRRLYVQSWALLVERLRARREGDVPDGASHLAAAYSLVGPDTADLLPVTTTELWAIGTPEGRDAVADGLVAEPQRRFGDPVLREVSSPAGTAVRLQQYLVVPDSQGADTVETSVAYVWTGPVDGTVVLLTAWFASIVDGEVHEPVLDALAGSLAFVEL